MRKKLYFIPQERYNEEVFRLVKELTAERSKVCYITLNKTTSKMKEAFAESGIDTTKFYFMDSVTPKLFKNSYPDDAILIDSVENLSKLADLVLTTIRMRQTDLVIIDSVSSMMGYRPDIDLIDFMQYLFAFLERLHIDIALFALQEDAERQFIKQLGMMVDETRGGRR